MSIKPSIIFFFITVIFSSCKRQLLNESKIANTNEAFVVNELNFNYMSGKAKINYADKGSDVNASLNIRVKKDSIIWLSLTAALGIEASRCLITKDSLLMLDRLNNHYYSYDYRTVSEKINFDINYSIIEAIILGNLPYAFSIGDSITRLPKENTNILIQYKPGIRVENAIGAENLKVKKINIRQRNTQQNLEVYYADFKAVNEFLFPFNNVVKLNIINNMVNETTTISIEYNKVEFSDKALSFPFNIPSKFVKK